MTASALAQRSPGLRGSGGGWRPPGPLNHRMQPPFRGTMHWRAAFSTLT